MLKGTNDQPLLPGCLRVNGSDRGEISGAAILIWRARNRVSQEVVFYDEISHASPATYEITVLHGAHQVWQQNSFEGEAWEFAGERDANGGLLFDELTFVLRATQPGFARSAPVAISVTRTSVV